MNAEFENELEARLTRHLATGPHRVPQRLVDSIRYSLLAPGKRIRPRLVLECAHMIGLPREAALAPAVAIEMIHCFTLIHDDLPCMDDDDFRRGRPSNHRQFDEATALLAGDGLMGLALDSLLDAQALVPPAGLVQAFRRLAEAIGPRGVVGGQAAEPELGPGSSREALESMHARKTGALFDASLLMPADLAGIAASDSRFQALARFSAELGLAFQVADDIEDAGTEKRESVSILAYIPVEQARRETHQRLSDAIHALEEAWGHDRARGLATIAGEVLKKVQP